MFLFSDDTNLTFKPISLESAYIMILNNNLNESEAIFSVLNSPRAEWGVSLVQILIGYLKKDPTYLGIRNFFEIDLDFLLKNDKIEYIELMLGATDYLVNINPEVYKYAARVMLENKMLELAKKYLDKSKSVFYKDPELHFMYTTYFMKTKEYTYAKYHIEECLKILPDYYPAKKLRCEIQNFV